MESLATVLKEIHNLCVNTLNNDISELENNALLLPDAHSELMRCVETIIELADRDINALKTLVTRTRNAILQERTAAKQPGYVPKPLDEPYFVDGMMNIIKRINGLTGVILDILKTEGLRTRKREAFNNMREHVKQIINKLRVGLTDLDEYASHENILVKIHEKLNRIYHAQINELGGL